MRLETRVWPVWIGRQTRHGTEGMPVRVLVAACAYMLGLIFVLINPWILLKFQFRNYRKPLTNRQTSSTICKLLLVPPLSAAVPARQHQPTALLCVSLFLFAIRFIEIHYSVCCRRRQKDIPPAQLNSHPPPLM